MIRKKRRIPERPDITVLEAELKQARYHERFVKIMKDAVIVLVAAAAASVLIATLWLPVFQIFGSSMSPTLHEGEIVLALKGNSFHRGDVIGFYYGSKLLVKRYIAGPGEWIDIAEDGTVYVNDEALEEAYISEKAFGNCNIDLPYQVPENHFFVLGDHRDVSIDSRNTAIGCISDEQVVGKIVFCVWPISNFGLLKNGGAKYGE